MSDLNIRLLTPTQSDEAQSWETYAQEKDPSTGYFSLTWQEIFQEAFGHSSYPLAAFRDGQICGILPLTLVASRLFGRHLVSMPFVNYGGVLANEPAIGRALLARAEQLRAELQAEDVELRHKERQWQELLVRGEKVSMYLDLMAEPDQMWKSFKDKVRNQVRKAEKSGLTIERGRVELLDDFYQVFCVNMRDLGTPVYSRQFFATVLSKLPKATQILAVRKEGRCIAAGITYAYGDTLQLPWASSLLEFRKDCPNHTLYWEAISRACSDGFKYFDFGRSTRESGPWRFKKQWGSKELPLHWEYLLPEGGELPSLNTSNKKFSLAINAWKRLPLPIANFLGPWIVRCIP